MLRSKITRAAVMVAAMGSLTACQVGPGPIEQMAIQSLAACNTLHDAQACGAYWRSASLIQGERDRQVQNNATTMNGIMAAIAGVAVVASAFAH